ncbi:hypothetical protein Ccrd_004581 [Cynara cardunculus var. scolymus]|uniref:Uncharacterized protein n=1 Tax=Cynara cardunculus var. scolymus TaxID=59895 RepID=A0A103XMA9_CYNCS|nr:hypothetical protein Ccrd_004581 [Cynara cardunculus var. scolymus]
MQSSLYCLTWFLHWALDEDVCATYTFSSVAVAGLAGDLWVHATRNSCDAYLWLSFWLLQPCSIIHKPELMLSAAPIEFQLLVSTVWFCYASVTLISIVSLFQLADSSLFLFWVIPDLVICILLFHLPVAVLAACNNDVTGYSFSLTLDAIDQGRNGAGEEWCRGEGDGEGKSTVVLRGGGGLTKMNSALQVVQGKQKIVQGLIPVVLLQILKLLPQLNCFSLPKLIIIASFGRDTRMEKEFASGIHGVKEVPNMDARIYDL